MAKINKPDGLNKIWSQAGDNTAPSDAKISLGWVSEVPPRQTFNYLDNKQDAAIAAINQSGIPEWDDETEYQAGFSHTLGSNGVVYKCITTHTNVNPVTDTANTAWKRAFASADGDIVLEGRVTLPDGSAAEPSYSFNSTDNTGLFVDPASKALVVTVAGVEKVRFNQSTVTINKAVTLQEQSFGVTATSGDSSTKLATTAFVADAVQEAGSFVLGVGAVAMYAHNNLPSGWLECNGAAVSRTLYADLFAKIGVSYGVGDGVNTFNLPDCRGEFVRGWDNGRGVDSGRSLGSTQTDSFKTHAHTATTDANGLHTHETEDAYFIESSGVTGTGAGTAPNLTGNALGSAASDRDNNRLLVRSVTSSSQGSHSHTVNVTATGGTETRPRNIAFVYAIKY